MRNLVGTKRYRPNVSYVRVGSNRKHMFDETYVFMIFPTYVSSSFGSNRNIHFSLRKTFDPRRGFRHLCILHSLTVATRGVKTYVDRCNWPSKSYVLRPKSYVKNALTSPDIEKRCRSNICFEPQKHMFCELKTYVLSGLTRPLIVLTRS